MSHMSIPLATAIYEDASQCEIIRQTVNHPELGELSKSISTLKRLLNDQIGDDFWVRTLGPICRTSFAFCSTPLPFALAAEKLGMDWSFIHRQVRLCKQLFPNAHESLMGLVQKLEMLSNENDSPLIKPLEDLFRHSGSLSVILKNSRLNQAVMDYFGTNSTLRKAKVVGANQLRNAHLCKVLASIGPCGWFPEYIFSAPRVTAIHVIAFQWFRDTWKHGPVFLHNSDASGSKHHSHRIGSNPILQNGATQSQIFTSDIIIDDLLPPMPNFDNNKQNGGVLPSDGSEETTPARLCYLCGNRAVFVPADDGAKSLIIDTTATVDTPVKRTLTEDLEPGQYLLLRTSGGGDFIAPLADRILGDSAEKYRSDQAEWKKQLVAKAGDRFGNFIGRHELASKVCSDLHLRGLSQAQTANVQYWMSSKCIRPRKEEDFLAILTFGGLEGRAKELWSAMGDILKAHARAGHLIRKMLLRKIDDTSLELLKRDGEFVFDLGDQDGGSLSAFEIIRIRSEKFEIPIDRIGVLLNTGE